MIFKPSNRLSGISEYYFAAKLAEIAKMNTHGSPVINLGIGSPDLPVHPNVTAVLSASSLAPAASMYQSYRGIPELRQAFAQHYAQHFQFDLDPTTEILPLMGSKEGIMHIAMSFLNSGDRVLVPNPGYPAYSATARIAGANVIYYQLSADNNWLPDIHTLASLDLQKVKLMWINYPHMPTGATITLDALETLVKFARRHNIILCHDNPYNYILNTSPLSIFQIPDAKDCCLELFSMSKAYNMSGWRVGALIGHAELINIVLRFKSNMDSGMYQPIQRATIAALQLGEEWFDGLNKIYQDRRKLVWDLFDRLDCTYDQYAAGLFVWAKVPDYVHDVSSWVDEILHEARVFITPGFIFGSAGERYVRAALCTESESIRQATYQIETQFIKAITQS